MAFFSLATGQRMALTIGKSRILGELLGVRMATFALSEVLRELENVASRQMHPIRL
jgi:hypothetical protein